MRTLSAGIRQIELLAFPGGLITAGYGLFIAVTI
jgi:hypothetical protein